MKMKNVICSALSILSVNSYLFSSQGPADDKQIVNDYLKEIKIFLIQKDCNKYATWQNIAPSKDILSQLHTSHFIHIQDLTVVLNDFIKSKVGDMRDEKKIDEINEIKVKHRKMTYLLWQRLDQNTICDENGAK